MDYRKQAAKPNPFEGLSMPEKKKMVVYFHHCANPRKNNEEIFQQYGFCLPFEEQMYLGEEMNLAIQIEKELAGNVTEEETPSASDDKVSPANTGCLVPLLVGLSGMMFGLMLMILLS